MSLIDRTYFDGVEINIPYDDEGLDPLSEYIDRYEAEILRRVLGSTLYESVIASPSTEPYKSIVSGKDYTYVYGGETHTVKWAGLINDDKISLIAYYVYYFWQRNHATLTNYSGEIKPGFENAASASVSAKVQNAWRQMERLCGYPGQFVLEPSLYNFLYEHEDSYPTWLFRRVGSVNAWDL